MRVKFWSRTSQQDLLKTLEGRLDQLMNDLRGFYPLVATQNDMLKGMEGAIIEIENAIGLLQHDLAGLTKSVGTVKSRVTKLEKAEK